MSTDIQTTTVKADIPGQSSLTPLLLNIVAIWHIILAIGLLGGVVYLWQSPDVDLTAFTKSLASVVGLGFSLASLAAAYFIFKRNHAGRFIALVLNYLGFLAFLLLTMHFLELFIGLNSLAQHLLDGLIYFVLALGGYVVVTLADRFEGNPAAQRLVRQMGMGLIIVFSLIGLYQINTIQGFLSLLQKFNDGLIIGLSGGAILFGFMLWAIWREPSAQLMGVNNARGETISGYLFLSPNLLGFLFFFAGPLLFSLYISFTNSDAFNQPEFIGLDNYAKILSLTTVTLASPDQLAREVLDVTIYDELTRISVFGQNILIGAQDKLFWISLRNTFLFVLLAVPLSVVPALVLANLLNTKLPGMKFFRAAYFLPSVAAVVGISLIWQLLYNATIGYINYFITVSVNFLNSVFGLALVDPQITWLSDSRTAMIALVIMSAWQWLGFNTVLFLAGLQQIPGSLYEAATVDGAGKWAKFWHITLPSLAPTTFFVVTTAVIQAMQLFDQVFILMNPPAGPNNSTLTMVLYLYQNGFQRFQQGYASAIAWVLFGAIFLVTLIQFQRQRAEA